MASYFIPEITVKALLDRYPELVPTFMNLGLRCTGCPAETFHTLGDVARENGLDPEAFFSRLHSAVEKGRTPRGEPIHTQETRERESFE